MAPDPDSTDGIGAYSDGQPDFEPPAGVAPFGASVPDGGREPDAIVPAVAPAAGQPSSWAPPRPDAVGMPAPATGAGRTGARRAGRPRRALVAAVLAGGLLLVGLLSALPTVRTATQPTTGAVATPALQVVTVSPSASATAPDTLSSGGGLGKAVAFAGAAGSGTVRVTSATWTDAGEAAPPEGRRYLVLDVTVACNEGSVPVDPVLFLAATSRGEEVPAFGPDLDQPLGGRAVAASTSVTGQLGYALVPGAVELRFLDEQLSPLVTIEIPAP